MQEQQVELLDAELAGALLERVQRGVVAVVADPDFRFDEDIVTRNPRATNAFAYLSLVGVRGGGVDEAVAGLHRRFDRARSRTAGSEKRRIRAPAARRRCSA